MAEQAAIVPIDGGMLRFYEELNRATPPEAVAWPLVRQRRSWEEVCKAFRAPRPLGVVSQDVLINRKDGKVPARIYRPELNAARPAVVYLHGGGWVLGSLETHDDMCAEIAAGAGVAVVAVDYRLAPENTHPAQLEDNLAVIDWMRSDGERFGIDARRIVAAGDSAGGQMTASLAMYMRDHEQPPLAGQVLIYPVLGIDLDTASYARNADAPCLTRAEMVYYWNAVLGPPGNRNWTDKYIIPLLERDYRGLPPAFIAAAAHDPLYDDAVAYAERLQLAGVPAQLRSEPALAHSYMRARHVSKPAAAGFAAIIGAVRELAESHARPT